MHMVISIGSNLDSPEVRVGDAIDRLAREFRLLARSSIYRTEPVGKRDQPEFRNAVAIIEDDRPPHVILRLLHEMEDAAGRVRHDRWGPRVLDLDLIAAGDVISDDPDCTLPHPRAHERAFVLIPWLEIDSNATLPGHGSVRDLVPTATGQVSR